VQFSALNLCPPILEAIKSEGYETATPIQAKAIPFILAGKDVLGCAQTGTGKTAAFAVPILNRLAAKRVPLQPRKPRCLVLAPTRELAVQISDSFKSYGKGLQITRTVVFGGVGQNPQVDALRKGAEILIATPGRLMDLMEQRHVDLSAVEIFVLDEADRMLDMGFIQPIRRIVSTIPQARQTLMFSATMPTEIRRLADQMLKTPAVVEVARVSATADSIEETVYRVEKRDKPALLAHLVKELPMYRTIVFTKTKHGADRVVRHLHKYEIKAEAIHGNKSQNARQKALKNFSSDRIPVLVATDIASRGIDVDGITHVVNYDLTHEPETYVHRIGRTARAGASGCAVSFCDREERSNLRAIEKLIRRTLKVIDSPLPASDPNAQPGDSANRPAAGTRPSQQEMRNDHRDRRDDRRPSFPAPGAFGRQQQRPMHGGPRPQGGHAPRPAGGHAPRNANQQPVGRGVGHRQTSSTQQQPAADTRPPRRGGAGTGGGKFRHPMRRGR
jgi:ATP-dependent RNA helicase RhlE